MTLQERIDQLVVQRGSLRAVARVTEVDVGYLSRFRAGEKVNREKDKVGGLGLRRIISYQPLKTPNVCSEMRVRAGTRLAERHSRLHG